jgi:predicted O-methyltransferase YrrM
MSNTIKNILLAILLVFAATAFFANQAIVKESQADWAKNFRSWWQVYQSDSEHRTTLAPDLERQEAIGPLLKRDDYELTEDWFTHKSPAFIAAVEPFRGKPNINYLEIGVFQGMSVIWMLENILTDPTSRITAIDIFQIWPEGSWEGIYSEEQRQTYLRNVERAGGGDRVRTITNYSQTALRELPLASYDIIYIDGAHGAPEVLEDAVLSLRLLKAGGILIFDDYRWEVEARMMSRPKLAIDTFLNFYGEQFELLHNGAQVILRLKELDSISQGMDGNESDTENQKAD